MRREVEIVNKMGLHARPAAEFVRAVHRLESVVRLWKGEASFDAGSILEVLTANLDCGTRIVLETVGPDEEQAMEQLCALLREFRRQEEDGRM